MLTREASVKNVVIAQSGGPTAVINNSLRGTIDVLQASGQVGTIYGAKMGILGVLQEELLDISAQEARQIALLEQTPSAGVFGSCRYKIKSEEDMARLVEVFSAHNVGYFFYCGGNDSMDTADKVSRLAQQKGLDLICTGIAKTIDNDVGGPLQPDGTFAICDHDPGYGSTARSMAVNILEANQENKASYTSDPVLVTCGMGRKIGFITAAARLADPKRRIPLVIVLPEALNKNSAETNLEIITAGVNEKLKQAGRCLVVVSEGVNVGDLDILRDSFGHEQFSASGRSAEQAVTNYLNGLDRKDAGGRAVSRLAVRGIARSERPGTRQRREFATVSRTDLEEAYQVGAHAARIALAGESGYMSTIVRTPGDSYRVAFDRVSLNVVANAERKFPAEWIAAGGLDVADEFVRWGTPLLGGPLPELADFKDVTAPTRCGDYTPSAFRK